MQASAVAGGGDALTRRWQEAEERLYPGLLFDEDAYRRCVGAVQDVADRLSDCRTQADLLARYEQRSDLVAAVGDLGGPAPRLVVDAAFRLRHRRLLADERRAEVGGRLADARAEGRTGWVTLLSRGADADPPAPPFERLEVHLPGGACLHRRVDLDPETVVPRYEVRAFRVDPDTGEQIPDASLDARADAFAEPREWRRAVAALRAACADAEHDRS